MRSYCMAVLLCEQYETRIEYGKPENQETSKENNNHTDKHE